MEQKVKKAYLLYGLSVLVTVSCFSFLIYSIIAQMKGDMVLSAVLMLMVWFPCGGMVLLEVMVYIWGLKEMQASTTDMQKQGKYPWIFTMISNAYFIVVGLLFVFANFQNCAYYLFVIIPIIANFAVSIWWLKYYNSLFGKK